MLKKSRRNLLKGFGISIPTAWAAPIIEAVLLPAHATTSGIDIVSIRTPCGEDWHNGSSGDCEEQLEGHFPTRCDCETAVAKYVGLGLEDCALGKRPIGASWGHERGSKNGQCYAEFEFDHCPDEHGSTNWDIKWFAEDCSKPA